MLHCFLPSLLLRLSLLSVLSTSLLLYFFCFLPAGLSPAFQAATTLAASSATTTVGNFSHYEPVAHLQLTNDGRS